MLIKPLRLPLFLLFFPVVLLHESIFSLAFIVLVKKTFRFTNVFSTTNYAAIPYSGTFLWKAV